MDCVYLEQYGTAAEALEVPEGVTAIVGGGGKTSLLLRLAWELKSRGSVIVTTSTHIYPPKGMELLILPTEEAICAALSQGGPLCIGAACTDGKLGDAGIPYARLARLARYVLVEADGARGLPLKANRPYEPVIPDCARLVVAVAGMDGVGKTVQEAACRPELYREIAGAPEDDVITAGMAAKVLTSPFGQRKGLPEGARFSVLLNKADTPERLAAAERVAAQLWGAPVERVVIGALLPGGPGGEQERF